MLDTMCLCTGGWPGLICRGHRGHSVTSLTLKEFIFMNTVTKPQKLV